MECGVYSKIVAISGQQRGALDPRDVAPPTKLRKL